MRVITSVFLCLILFVSCKKDKVISIPKPFSAPDSFHIVNACNTSELYVIETSFGNDNFAIQSNIVNFRTSNDDGNTWTTKSSPEGGGFCSYVRSKDTFYLYNNKIFYTEDGGDHFEVLDSSMVTHDLVFLSKNVGIKTGINIYRTTDGGHNWEKTYTANGFLGAKQIQFPSPTVGYSNVCFQADLSVYGTIIKTVDGGITWQEILPNIGEFINDISFVSTKTGYFTTIYGDLYKTTDGGNTWTLVSDYNAVNVGYNQIEFVTETQGYLWNSGSYTKVYLTKDSGNTWTLVADTGCDNVQNVQRVGNSIFITGRYGTILKSN
jgi:photosystem II stability/assembly factor-like uncharacterized protein